MQPRERRCLVQGEIRRQTQWLRAAGWLLRATVTDGVCFSCVCDATGAGPRGELPTPPFGIFHASSGRQMTSVEAEKKGKARPEAGGACEGGSSPGDAPREPWWPLKFSLLSALYPALGLELWVWKTEEWPFASGQAPLLLFSGLCSWDVLTKAQVHPYIPYQA